MIITIDGPAGAGKSTVARAVADRLGLPYLNSGAIYRAVTLSVLESGGDFEDRDAVSRTIASLRFESDEREGRARFLLDSRDVTSRLKDPDVTAKIFRIADDPRYREKLVDLQREAVSERGVVAEGRDMGTVIFPHAQAKFFLEAPAEERARRQHEELLARGVESDLDELVEAVRRRDQRDRSRVDAPLRVADDAVVVETGGRSVDDVVSAILEEVRRRFPRRARSEEVS